MLEKGDEIEEQSEKIRKPLGDISNIDERREETRQDLSYPNSKVEGAEKKAKGKIVEGTFGVKNEKQIERGVKNSKESKMQKGGQEVACKGESQRYGKEVQNMVGQTRDKANGPCVELGHNVKNMGKIIPKAYEEGNNGLGSVDIIVEDTLESLPVRVEEKIELDEDKTPDPDKPSELWVLSDVEAVLKEEEMMINGKETESLNNSEYVDNSVVSDKSA